MKSFPWIATVGPKILGASFLFFKCYFGQPQRRDNVVQVVSERCFLDPEVFVSKCSHEDHPIKGNNHLFTLGAWVTFQTRKSRRTLSKSRNENEKPLGPE